MSNVIRLPVPYVLPDRAAEARDGLATELRVSREKYMRTSVLRALREGKPLSLAELQLLDREPDLLAEAWHCSPIEPEYQPEHLGGFR